MKGSIVLALFLVLIVVQESLIAGQQIDRQSDTCLCGQENLKTRIVGGRNVANSNQYPWMVGLIFDSEETYSRPGPHIGCAGSLINDRFVLTAAHCVYNQTVDKVDVKLGVHTLTDVRDKPREPVSEIFVHPKFESASFKNDVALIKLATPVTFSPFVSPMCLPWTEPNILDGGVRLLALGWGYTDLDRPGASEILREVNLEAKRWSWCRYYHDNPFPQSQLCAGDAYQCTYYGDSGGPLVDRLPDGRLTQVGITSYGHPKCIYAYAAPSVFMRVHSYLDFIDSVVSQADAGDGITSSWCA